MSYHQAKELLIKYQNGNCTDAEKALVEKWLFQYNNNAVDILEEEFAGISQEIWNKIAAKPIRKISVWPRIAAAAAVLLIISFSAYFVLHKKQTIQQLSAQSFKNDVKPGHNGATLTLANGKIISLTNAAKGQLAIQGNIAVNKTADGQVTYQVIGGTGNEVMENTLSTSRKQQYKIILADGTAVWLNASSSISYPTAFNGKDREVSITGEAYFEVEHNAAKPFKVISNGQTVEVLGTHFNVNTYTDEPDVKTTLLEGSVKVSNNEGYKIIKPGQQAIAKGGLLLVNDANIEETVAWKNGYFRFNGEKIETIMRRLSRWYDIDVKFEGPVPNDEFSGTISRFKNLSEVLEALEYYNTVHFKIEGRRVTVLQ